MAQLSREVGERSREKLEREVYSVNLKTSRIERVHLETKYYSPFDIWHLLNGHLYQIC